MEKDKSIALQCVYGNEDSTFIEKVLLPSLEYSFSGRIKFYCLNFEDPNTLISAEIPGVEIINIPPEAGRRNGFSRNHNLIFKHHLSKNFVLVNPDCIPSKNSLDILWELKEQNHMAAIIESSQWPFEHPKKYDPYSRETSWASGFFSMIDGLFFQRVGGFDENFFLYCEDVDLSWQAWLNGYKVIYAKESKVVHFTDFKFARSDLPNREEVCTRLSFLILSYKYFGEKGLSSAYKMMTNFIDFATLRRIVEEFEAIRPAISTKYQGISHPMVKILGYNLFA